MATTHRLQVIRRVGIILLDAALAVTAKCVTAEVRVCFVQVRFGLLRQFGVGLGL